MTIDRPTGRDIPALRQLWQQAFGDSDAFLDGFFATGFSPARCRCLHLEGGLASALYWFDCRWKEKKVAYLYAVATEAAFRGRGLCRTLMEDTHRHLRLQGYSGAALVPGNEGLFSLYKKLGYRPFCPMRTVTVDAGEPAITPRSISPDSFLLQRRNRLPENGLLQGKETVAFLATFAQFYTAGDALFAVAREESTLHFQEYLGDPGLLGGVIAALGAKKGIVHLPGGNRNTAMYLPLNGGKALPAYLGIPLN